MSKRLVKAFILLFATTLLGGCLYDATLDANGGGTMTVKYRLTSKAQFRSSKRRMESPQVRLTDSSIDDEKWATFVLAFDDVTKLPTAEFFSRATVSLIDDADGTTTLTVKFANEDPVKLLDELIEYFGNEVTVTVHLPGEIVKSNGSEQSGTTEKWSYTLREFTESPEISMSVTYKKSAGGAAKSAAAGEPTAAPTPATGDAAPTPAANEAATTPAA